MTGGAGLAPFSEPDAVAAVAARAALGVQGVVRLEAGLFQTLVAAATGNDPAPTGTRGTDVAVEGGVASIDMRVILSRDCDRLLDCVQQVQEAVGASVLEVTGLTSVVTVVVWALAT